MLMWRGLDRNCQQAGVKQLLKRFRRALQRAGGAYTHIGFVVGHSLPSSVPPEAEAFRSTLSLPCGATRSTKPCIAFPMLSLLCGKQSRDAKRWFDASLQLRVGRAASRRASSRVSSFVASSPRC
jgi:hypothetical protein